METSIYPQPLPLSIARPEIETANRNDCTRSNSIGAGRKWQQPQTRPVRTPEPSVAVSGYCGDRLVFISGGVLAGRITTIDELVLGERAASGER